MVRPTDSVLLAFSGGPASRFTSPTLFFLRETTGLCAALLY
jgi:hypothetical protein